MFAQPRFAREITGRNVIDQPATKHGFDFRAFGGREFLGQYARIAVEREVERAQEQIKRFVVGARSHLTEGGAGFGVEFFHAAQPVAKRGPSARAREEVARFHPAIA